MGTKLVGVAWDLRSPTRAESPRALGVPCWFLLGGVIVDEFGFVCRSLRHVGSFGVETLEV